MWTPAIQRDRRIALQDRSTRFFGTDFSFEDLEERDVDQYDYTMLGEETHRRRRLLEDRIDARGRRSRRSTRRRIVWVRKDNYAFQRIENFIKDAVVRRLKYSTSRTCRASGPRACSR